jgi:hypothetical protein
MSLSPIPVARDPVCVHKPRIRGWRIDPQHLIEQRGHCAERFQTDERVSQKAHVGRACGPVEHPGLNLERPRTLRAVQCATEDAASLVGRAVNENIVPKPGMELVEKLSAHRPVGVLKPCCTTPRGHTDPWATSRQRRRPSCCQPLHAYAAHRPAEPLATSGRVLTYSLTPI